MPITFALISLNDHFDEPNRSEPNPTSALQIDDLE